MDPFQHPDMDPGAPLAAGLPEPKFSLVHVSKETLARWAEPKEPQPVPESLAYLAGGLHADTIAHFRHQAAQWRGMADKNQSNPLFASVCLQHAETLGRLAEGYEKELSQ